MGDIVQKVKVDEEAVQPLNAVANATDNLAQADKDLKRETEALNRETRDLGKETEDLGRKTEAAKDKSDQSGEAMAMLRGQMMGLIGSLTGGLGLIQLFDDYRASIEATNEALKENARLTRAAAEARLDLAALKGYESKEDIAFINNAAAFAGRDPAEIAQTMTTIGGAVGPDNKEAIEALTMQVAAKAQQTTASMGALVQPFIQVFKRTQDARVASNILEGAIDAAEEPDPANVGKTVGAVLSMQSLTGLGIGESAGAAAGMSGLGLQSAEVATTSFRNVALALRGEGKPEGNEILAREGIDRENLLPGLKQMLEAIREGRITRQEQEKIAGIEGMAFIGAMVDPNIANKFYSSIDSVKNAEAAEGVVLSRKSKKIFESDPQALNLLTKQMESTTAGTQGNDNDALKAAAVRATIAAVLAQAQAAGKISAADVAAKLEAYDTYVAKGHDPIKAAELAETDGTFLTNLTKTSARFGPELGLPAFDALRLGPNLDPNTRREFLPIPAGGGLPWEIDVEDPYTLSSFSKSITITNIYGSTIVERENPMSAPSPSQLQE